jgi:endoglucanase
VADAVVDVRFVMLWEQIASRFKGRSDRLVLELYNEPHGRMNGEPWNVLAARTLRVVRASNPDRAVVIGPTHWNSAGDLTLLKLPNDANLIVTVHDYNPFTFTHQGAEWVSPVLPIGVTCCSAAQVADMTAPLDVAKTWAAVKRYPVYVGEFGAYSKADESSRVTFNRTMRDAIEARGMTWAYWEFASGFGVYDPTARTFRQGLLDSLLR